MAQRLGLAQAFINDPDILVLDEPTSGLDPVGRSEVIEFLLKQKKNNKTIFFCSHILSEVEQVCDKIGILVKGQLKISGKIKYLFQQTKTHNLNQLFKKMVKNTE
jgi:ABC-2 type transport system ATP-binding protein